MKPILFNTEMVRAILDGRKTVTRRIIKEIPNHMHYGKRIMDWDLSGVHDFENGILNFEVQCDVDDSYHSSAKPKYKVGDVLYVRETWQNVFETEYDRDAEGYCVNIRTQISNFDDIPKTDLGLSTEDSCALMKPRTKYSVYLASDISYSDEKHKLRWRPSLHMPKEAARLFLKVTDVKVERLQAITAEQCADEGIDIEGMDYRFEAVDEFSQLWNSTTKKSDLDQFGWDSNPWVWVVEFQRCEKPESEDTQCT